jgi:hypothetical protein
MHAAKKVKRYFIERGVNTMHKKNPSNCHKLVADDGLN